VCEKKLSLLVWVLLSPIKCGPISPLHSFITSSPFLILRYISRYTFFAGSSDSNRKVFVILVYVGRDRPQPYRFTRPPTRFHHPSLSLSPTNQSTTRKRRKMGVTPKIAPSMLSSDFANLASEAHRMINYGADWLHMDIMVRTHYFLLLYY
jgi:hypothetical protein